MGSIERNGGRKTATYIAAAQLLLIALLMYLCNHWTIFAADDYANYAFTWLDHDTFDLTAVINSTNNIYNGMTGRWLSTFVNGVFLFFSNYTKEIFNIANTAMFVLMIYYLNKIFQSRRENAAPQYFALFLAVWFFTPAFGQSMLWEIGSVIYLWPLVAALAWICPYVQMIDQDPAPNLPRAIGLFLAGLLAGNGHEITAGTAICFVSLILLMRLIGKKRLPAWAWIGFVGMLIGLMTNMLAPGVINRFGVMGSADLPPIGKLGLVFYNGFCNSYIYILFFSCCILSIVYYIALKKKRSERLNLYQVLYLVSVGLLSVGVFSLALLINMNFLNSTDFWNYLCMVPMSRIMLFSTLFALAFLLAVFCFFAGKMYKDLSPRDIVMILFTMIAAICALVVFYIAPYSWPRSYIFTAVMLILAACYMIGKLIGMSSARGKWLFAIPALLAVVLLAVSYYNAADDMHAAYQWQETTRQTIYEEIAKGSEYIMVPTFMSQNSHNAASVEKWVIPAIIDDEAFRSANGVHIYYEWINIEQTNYFFHDKYAWANGKRIIGVEE